LKPIDPTKKRELQAHEIGDTRSAPIIVDEKIKGATERSHAAREPHLEIALARGLLHGLARNRLNEGDQVLDAMTELAISSARKAPKLNPFSGP
jgi:hypothetical protein